MYKSKPVIIVLGTRPGAIKLLPVYKALKQAGIPTLLCATFQHDHLLQQVLDTFNVSPDITLNIMLKNQDLFYLTSAILNKLKEVYLQLNPQLIIVHGDTTTTFSAGMAAFYLKIPIAHLEAGLRTGKKYAPFPEELNRIYLSHIATYNFAPTALNVANLLREGIDQKSIFCVGNVVVDALLWINKQIKNGSITIDEKITKQLNLCKQNKQKIIVLTAHRRESFNGGLLNIFNTIKKFLLDHKDVFVFFPVHPNPNVLQALKESGLDKLTNIYCSQPLGYKELIHLITESSWIMTDSGGIQEEGISIGKKILILRDVTERVEGVWEGLCHLVGTNPRLIEQGMNDLYHSNTSTSETNTIYGDGQTCKRIVTILKPKLNYPPLTKIENLQKIIM